MFTSTKTDTVIYCDLFLLKNISIVSYAYKSAAPINPASSENFANLYFKYSGLI